MTQVDTAGDNLTSAALASTGDAIVFGGSGGYVHLWALSGNPRMNAYSEVSSTLQIQFPGVSVELCLTSLGDAAAQTGNLQVCAAVAATGAAVGNATTGSAAQGARLLCAGTPVFSGTGAALLTQRSRAIKLAASNVQQGSSLCAGRRERVFFWCLSMHAPVLQGKLLSDFDPSAPMKQGLLPRIVDPALLASSRKADFVQYIQNPHFSKDAPFGQATAKIAAARNTRIRVSTSAQDR